MTTSIGSEKNTQMKQMFSGHRKKEKISKLQQKLNSILLVRWILQKLFGSLKIRWG